MSREFITPLVICGSKEQQEDIIKELVKLGYEAVGNLIPLSTLLSVLCTNFGPQAGKLGWITMSMMEARVKNGSILVHSDYKQLILALAAMSKEDGNIYKGEYYNFRNELQQAQYTRAESIIKATKEEIITYFTNKVMNKSIESNEYGSTFIGRSIPELVKREVDYYVLTTKRLDNIITHTNISPESVLCKELASAGLLHLLAPVYKDREKVIEVLAIRATGLAGNLKVTIKNGNAICEGQTFTKEQLRSMLISPSTVSRIGSIDFGCNSQYRVSREEIEKVIKEM